MENEYKTMVKMSSLLIISKHMYTSCRSVLRFRWFSVHHVLFIVKPYFIYCNIIWGNTFTTYLKKLEKLQKKSLGPLYRTDRISVCLTKCKFIPKYCR